MLVSFDGKTTVDVPLSDLPPTFANLPAGWIPGITPLITTTQTQAGKTGDPEPFYVPTIKQFEMHLCPAKNLLYGGRAGTGKSVGLRMDGYSRCLVQPNYRVLLVRRQMTELRDTHLDKLDTEADMIGARYRASETTVVFPMTNSRFRFGHVEDDQALKQYLSSEFDLILFDEGATFTEFQYRFLCSRLRSARTGAKAGVIPMVRIGSNPGAMWLYDYYISKDVDPQRDPGYRKQDYYFIPATVKDNPHVDQAEYNMRLDSLPSEALRRMYRDGDWLAVEGQMFEEWRPTRLAEDETVIPWHVTPEIPKHAGTPVLHLPWIEIVRAVDWGYSEEEPGVCLWFAMLPDGSALGFQEYVFTRTKPEDVAREIKRRSVLIMPNGSEKPMKVRYTVGDPSMFAERTGESIAETFSKRQNGGISMIEGDNSHPTGLIRLHSWLQTERMSGRYPYPALQYLSPSSSHYYSGCPYTTKTLPMLTKDKTDPSRVGTHQPDHGMDASKYFVMSRPALSREPKQSIRSLPPALRRAILRANHSHDRLGVESVRR